MQNTLDDEIVETDILIVGGGLAGCWAAIRARNLPIRVVLVDKGSVSHTGCSTFSAGDIACPMSDDEHHAWAEEVKETGRGLCDQYWVDTCLTEIYKRVLEMEAFGVPFEKVGGHFVQAAGRGKLIKSVIVPGRNLMKAMRAQVSRLGAEIWDRIIVLALLVEAGRCWGVLGMHARTGQFFILKAKSVILTAGGCGFWGVGYGNQFATGDSHALAYRADVEQHGFEFVYHNTLHRYYNTTGMARFVASGGRFTNRLGQSFMEKYDPKFGDRAPLSTLILGMAKEVDAGRGPIYFDMAHLTQVEQERYKKFLPHMALMLERAGVDFRRERMPWIPNSGATYGMLTGCKIDQDCRTSIAGLFAAGAAAGVLRGAGGVQIGVPLMTCCVSGYIAGERASQYALEAKHEDIKSMEIEKIKLEIMAPLTKKEGVTHHELLAAIQNAIFPYRVMILKQAERLNAALKTLGEIEENMIPNLHASDLHHCVKAWETKNIFLTAQLFLCASLWRTESRGNHFREDFPEENDQQWLKWVIIKQDEGKIKIRLDAVKAQSEGDEQESSFW